jgi:hypothetical protein
MHLSGICTPPTLYSGLAQASSQRDGRPRPSELRNRLHLRCEKQTCPFLRHLIPKNRTFAKTGSRDRHRKSEENDLGILRRWWGRRGCDARLSNWTIAPPYLSELSSAGSRAGDHCQAGVGVVWLCCVYGRRRQRLRSGRLPSAAGAGAARAPEHALLLHACVLPFSPPIQAWNDTNTHKRRSS